MRALFLVLLLLPGLLTAQVVEGPTWVQQEDGVEAPLPPSAPDEAPLDLEPTFNRSPFTVVPEVEVPVLLSLTAVATLPRLFAHEAIESRCGLDCDPEHLLPFDRVAVGLNVPGANAASDVIMVGAMSLPYLANFIDVAANKGGVDGWAGYAADTLVLTETLAAATAATNLFGFLVRRPRPYTYDPGRSDSLRLHPIGQLSFFSGHAALVMAMGTASARLLQARHPGHPLVPIAWILTASAGTATCFLRPMAGQHFPSDVLAGAIAGLGIGVLVPALHERNHRARLRRTRSGARPPTVHLLPGVSPQGGTVSLTLSGW